MDPKLVPVTIKDVGLSTEVTYADGRTVTFEGPYTSSLAWIDGKEIARDRLYFGSGSSAAARARGGPRIVYENGQYYATQMPADTDTTAVAAAEAADVATVGSALTAGTVVGGMVAAGSTAAAGAVAEALTEEHERERAAQAAAELEAASYNTLIEGTFNDPSAAAVYTLRFYENWPPADPTNDVSIRVDLPYVNRVAMSAPNAVVRTRGMDGTVYAEHAGIPQRTFTIEGRSGAPSAPSTNSGFGLDIRRFTNLRNLIETYAATSARNKSALIRFKDSRLVLDFSFEDESYFCDVVDFNYRRSTETSTYSFEYTLTLVTNSPLARQANPMSLKAWVKPVGPPEALGSAMRQGQDELESDRTAFSDLALSEYKFYLADLPSMLRSPEKPGDSVTKLQDLSCSFLYDVRLGITVLNATLDNNLFTTFVPKKARAKIKSALSLSSYVGDLAHSAKAFFGSPDRGCATPTWTNVVYKALPYATLVDTFIRQFAPSNSTPAPSSDVFLPYRPGLLAPVRITTSSGPQEDYVVPHGMNDAHAIAATWLGDASLAWRIIAFNSMRDAYTFGDGTPLQPGSIIKLPAPDKPSVKNNDLLGTDLLIENGDLVLVGFNDIKRVSGYACYSQNLLHRVQTFRRHNKVFPNYGLPDDVLTNADSTIPAILRTQVKDQIRQDHRTKRVENITLTELGDKVHIDVVVTPISGPKGQLTFYYNLASGVTP